MSGWWDTFTSVVGKAAPLINIGATLGSAYLGSRAAENAQESNQQATENAMQLLLAQNEAYRPVIEDANQARAFLKDAYLPGGMSDKELSAMVKKSPGFGFASKELERMIERRQSKTHNLRTGRGFKEATRWTNDYLLEPWFDRQMAGAGLLAGYGPNAMGQMYNNAANQGNVLLSGARYGGEAGMGQAGIWANALKSVSSDLDPNQNQYMKAYADAMMRRQYG